MSSIIAYGEDLFDSGVTADLESDIGELDKVQVLRLEIDTSLESAINEINSLQKEYSRRDADNLVELCKQNVLSTIAGQFGIASILLEAKDGGSVTTARNFKKGITSSEADGQRYQDLQYVRHGGFKERRASYDKKKDEMRASVKAAGTKAVHDEYTGKTISIKRADVDHVVSAKEIETDADMHLFMDQEARVQAGTGESNLAFTKDKANRSKGSKKMEEWLDKKDADGRSNEEKFGIDRERAMARDKAVRKELSHTVNKEAFKKYSQELLATGGKDAAKMAAYSAIGVIMHDLTLAVVEELKYILKNKGNKTFKELFAHFKEKISETLELLKAKWKDILSGSLEAGLMAFFSNILVFVINLFATTLKKLVSMIRAGFVSLCKAVKLMVNPPAEMSQEEAENEAVKLLTAGLIGALSLGLSAMIEKFLQSIPGLQPIMMFPIPSFGGEPRTVSDILAVTLSALAGGLVTTITLYFMDKFINATKKDKLQMQLVTTSGVVVQCQVARSWLCMQEAYDFLAEEARQVMKTDRQTRASLAESNTMVSDGLRGWDAIKARMNK